MNSLAPERISPRCRIRQPHDIAREITTSTARPYKWPAVVAVGVVEPDVLLAGHVERGHAEPGGLGPVKFVEGGGGALDGVPQPVGAGLADSPRALCQWCQVDLGARGTAFGDYDAVFKAAAEPQARCVQPEEQRQIGLIQERGGGVDGRGAVVRDAGRRRGWFPAGSVGRTVTKCSIYSRSSSAGSCPVRASSSRSPSPLPRCCGWT